VSRSFEHHYWQALYLVDGDGRIRFHHFGEEGYEETERTIESSFLRWHLLGSSQAPALR
jgi:hypothetical protein